MSKEKFEELKKIFEEIDTTYGVGPNEPITDSNKVNTYIENFIEYIKSRLIFEHFDKINEDNSKSFIERLNELR